MCHREARPPFASRRHARGARGPAPPPPPPAVGAAGTTSAQNVAHPLVVVATPPGASSQRRARRRPLLPPGVSPHLMPPLPPSSMHRFSSTLEGTTSEASSSTRCAATPAVRAEAETLYQQEAPALDGGGLGDPDVVHRRGVWLLRRRQSTESNQKEGHN